MIRIDHYKGRLTLFADHFTREPNPCFMASCSAKRFATYEELISSIDGGTIDDGIDQFPEELEERFCSECANTLEDIGYCLVCRTFSVPL